MNLKARPDKEDVLKPLSCFLCTKYSRATCKRRASRPPRRGDRPHQPGTASSPPLAGADALPLPLHRLDPWQPSGTTLPVGSRPWSDEGSSEGPIRKHDVTAAHIVVRSAIHRGSAHIVDCFPPSPHGLFPFLLLVLRRCHSQLGLQVPEPCLLRFHLTQKRTSHETKTTRTVKELGISSW